MFNISSCLLIAAFFFLFDVKQSDVSFYKITMHFLLLLFFVPIIHTLVIVEIHPNSWYDPLSSCAFISNISWLNTASIQSCIWECVNEYNCQTAVYFKDISKCSMFAEFWETGSIASSEHVSASVICYRKSHGKFVLCFEIEKFFSRTYH